MLPTSLFIQVSNQRVQKLGETGGDGGAKVAIVFKNAKSGY